MVNKDTLRSTYLEKRLTLSDEELDKRNRFIFKRMIDNLDLEKVSHMHVFLPISEKKEVNTWLLIHHIRSRHPDMTLYTSRSLRSGELEHFILEEDTRLLVNKWGIPEPAEAAPLVPRALDLIIVPLIIFDKTGHRIGYGKGYYDRFLAHYPEALKVGVSLSPPLDNINFAEERDIALDRCLTPYADYQFR